MTQTDLPFPSDACANGRHPETAFGPWIHYSGCVNRVAVCTACGIEVEEESWSLDAWREKFGEKAA